MSDVRSATHQATERQHSRKSEAEALEIADAQHDELSLNQAADDGIAWATHAAAGLDVQTLGDLFEQVVEVARGYAARRRWDTFVRARRSRDLAASLAARTRRPTDLVDLYLVGSLASGLMASAAFDLARWPAATSLARTSRTFAQLSGHPGAIGWAHGLLATLLNWNDRPHDSLREIDVALAAQPGRAGQYRLHSIAARAHALRGDRNSAQNALDRAARHRPDDGRGSDLLHDDIAGEFRFDSPRAAACAGAVWLTLRDGTAAEQSLRTAVAGYEALSPRDRPMAPLHGARVDIAAACLLRGDLDAAGDALTPVFDLEPEQRISVIVARANGVRGQLNQSTWGGVQQARSLRVRIEDWMASAAATPAGGVN